MKFRPLILVVTGLVLVVLLLATTITDEARLSVHQSQATKYQPEEGTRLSSASDPVGHGMGRDALIEAPREAQVEAGQESSVLNGSVSAFDMPVARVQVSLKGSKGEVVFRTLTDSSGEFAVHSRDVSSATSVEFRRAGFLTQQMSRAPNEQRLDISLQPVFGVVGRVLDTVGDPVSATVSLEDAATGRVMSQDTWRNGQFLFSFESEAKSLDLVAQANQVGATCVSGIPAISRGTSQDLGVLVLAGSGRVEGRVLYPDGSPVVGRTVRAVHADDQALPCNGLLEGTTRTDDAGHFRIGGLMRGDYRLEMSGVETCDDMVARASDAPEPVQWSVTSHTVRVLLLDDDGPRTDLYCAFRLQSPDASTRQVHLQSSNSGEYYEASVCELASASVAIYGSNGVLVEEAIAPSGNDYLTEATLYIPSEAQDCSTLGVASDLPDVPYSIEFYDPYLRRVAAVRPGEEVDESGKLGAPCGYYHVTWVPRPAFPPSPYLRTTAAEAVSLRSGQETVVSFQPRDGATLTITIRSRGAEEYEVFLFGAEANEPKRLLSMGPTASGGFDLASAFSANEETAVSEVVPPGTYRLRVEAADIRQDQDITLRPGLNRIDLAVD